MIPHLPAEKGPIAIGGEQGFMSVAQQLAVQVRPTLGHSCVT